jgi:polysaccharide pyruvyl transferase WcaK-like protein/sulfatase maturation enzyme AslB (radical SAM superfamily)
MNIMSYINYLLNTFKHSKFPLEKPVVLQFPVNNICNSHCQMCHVWKQTLDEQVTLEEIEGVLSNPLFSEIRAVGLNGGEPTLRKDLDKIAVTLATRLPKLRSVFLITNALNVTQVIQQIEAVGKHLKEYGKRFDVMVSLDGVGDIHDLVRGRDGTFERTVSVIDFCKNTPFVSKTHLGCTVIRDNVYGLHDLLDFAIDRDVYIKFRLGIPHKRLYVDTLTDPFELTSKERLHFCTFLDGLIRQYEKSELQKHFYRSLIGQLLHGDPRTVGCYWQHRGVTVSARGELLYCAVESNVLGSAIDCDSEKLYFDNKNHLHEIVASRCADCKHDYVGLPSLRVAASQFLVSLFERLGVPLTQNRRRRISASINRFAGARSFAKRLKYHRKIAGDLAKPSKGYPKEHDQQIRALIVGWYGTETLGDKAILGGIIGALRNRYDALDIHLVSLDPAVSLLTLEQMPDLGDVSICNVYEGLKLLNNIDMLIFGGGPLMAINNMAEMQVFFERSRQLGKLSVVAGCGVGPFGRQFHNDSIKSLLSSADIRIYRDHKSLDNAQCLGIASDSDFVAEDPAFTWLQTSLNALPVVDDKKGGDTFRLLLGLRDWPVEQYAAHLSQTEAYRIKEHFEECLLDSLREIATRYEYLVLVPFPMCTNSHGGDDRWYLRSLIRKMSSFKGRFDMSCLSKELTPSEALNVFRMADAALAMRFHSLVFALASGLPTVAIDYTLGRGKVTSLAEAYQVPLRTLEEVDAEFIVDEMAIILSGQKTAQPVNPVTFPLIFSDSLKTRTG